MKKPGLQRRTVKAVTSWSRGSLPIKRSRRTLSQRSHTKDNGNVLARQWNWKIKFNNQRRTRKWGFLKKLFPQGVPLSKNPLRAQNPR